MRSSSYYCNFANIFPVFYFSLRYSRLALFLFLSSAGVGRTGTFMVIDSMLDRIKAESTIDIFNFVAYLRTRRTAMVQTEVCNTYNYFIMFNQMLSSEDLCST